MQIRSSRVFLSTALMILVSCNKPADVDWRSRPKPTSLPEEMAEYETTFRNTALEYAAIKAQKRNGTKPWESKFLGKPYMPMWFLPARAPPEMDALLSRDLSMY